MKPKPYTNKYLYHKTLQGWFAGRWEDLSEFVTNSMGVLEDCKAYKLALCEWREDYPDTSFRTVFRRELNAYYARFPEQRPW